MGKGKKPKKQVQAKHLKPVKKDKYSTYVPFPTPKSRLNSTNAVEIWMMKWLPKSIIIEEIMQHKSDKSHKKIWTDSN